MAALTTTLAILAIGSTAVSTYAQIKAGKAQKKAGETAATAQEKAGAAAQKASNSQGALADYNADIADLQAQDALERGAEEESRLRTQVRGIIGAQRAGQAAGNIDVSYGTAADVQADAAYLGELDALTIRTNARREAWGYKVQAEDLRYRGVIARQEGSAALEAARAGATGTRAAAGAAATQSYLGAASTLIGGTTSLLQMRYGFKK